MAFWKWCHSTENRLSLPHTKNPFGFVPHLEHILVTALCDATCSVPLTMPYPIMPVGVVAGKAMTDGC